VVPEQVGRLHWDAGRLAQYRSARLIETLGFAAEHSPWHAGRLSSLDLEAVTPEDLTSLPTMTHTSAPVNLVKGYPAPLPSW
jgi:phenylacetate-CoA ligase